MQATVFPFYQTVLCDFFQNNRLQGQEAVKTGMDVFHCHNGIELLFVHEGKGQAVIDGVFYPITGNTLIIIKPFQLHGLKIDESMTYCRSILLCDIGVLQPYFAPFLQLNHNFNQFCNQTQSKQIFLDLPDAFAQEYLFAKQTFAAQSYRGDMKEAHAMFLIGLFQKLFQYQPDASCASQKKMPQEEHMARIIAWVEAHYCEPYDATQMSKALMLSKYYLIHYFKQNMGISISEYITQRRLREAKIQLHTTTIPVEALGLSLGYSSASHFCKVFGRHVGVSPHQYRKRAVLELADMANLA